MTCGQYVSTGSTSFILYQKIDYQSLRYSFDLDKLKVTGSPVSILEGISAYAFFHSACWYMLHNQPQDRRSIKRIHAGLGNRQGDADPICASPNAYLCLRLSPDRSKVALAYFVKVKRRYLGRNLSRGTNDSVNSHEDTDYTPIWSTR